jgi:hypothetical protein
MKGRINIVINEKQPSNSQKHLQESLSDALGFIDSLVANRWLDPILRSKLPPQNSTSQTVLSAGQVLPYGKADLAFFR